MQQQQPKEKDAHKKQQPEEKNEKQHEKEGHKNAVLYPPSTRDPHPKSNKAAVSLPSIWDAASLPLESPDAKQGSTHARLAQLSHHWAEQAWEFAQQQQQQQAEDASSREPWVTEQASQYAASNLLALMKQVTPLSCSSPLAPGGVPVHDIAWALAHFSALDLLPGDMGIQLRALEQQMHLPFRVLPLLLPRLCLQDFINEVKVCVCHLIL